MLGATPPELAAQLAEAAQWIVAAGQRARAASLQQVRAGSRIRGFTVVYLILSAILLVVFGVFALLGIGAALDFEEVDFGLIVLFVPPVLVFAAAAAFGALRLVRLRRGLEEARSAVPAADGSTHECRMCGADLPPVSGAPDVHCRYCGAANLIDRRVLARVGASRVVTIDAFRESIRRQTIAANLAAERTLTGAILVAVGLPFLVYGAFIVGLIIVLIVSPPRHAPDEPLTTVPYKGEQCLATIRKLADGRLRVDGGALPDGTRWWKDLPKDQVTLVREADLKGKPMTLYGCAPEPKKAGDPPPPPPAPKAVSLVRVQRSLGLSRVIVSDGKEERSWPSSTICGICFP